MKIKRFFATDIRQAMRMVKDELGPDAVIMSNRAVDGGIEIVAARDFDEQTLQTKIQEQASDSGAKKPVLPSFEAAKKRFSLLDSHRKASPTPAPETAANQQPTNAQQPVDFGTKKNVLPNFDSARKRLQLENERKNAAALAAVRSARSSVRFSADEDTVTLSSQRTATPYVGYAEKIQLGEKIATPPKAPTTGGNTSTPFVKNELPVYKAPQNQAINLADQILIEMRQELKYLRSAMDAKFATIGQANTQPTPIRNELLQRLMNMGLSKKLSSTMANQFPDQSNLEAVFSKAQDMLSKAIPIAEDELLESGGIVALVGPTGVGKTTTVAKLAAKFILKHGASQVALITTDNYRIGAHEQLNTYGRILDVPVRVASSADDLRMHIKSFANKRLILIDTAGMGQRDMKLVDQISTLQKNGLSIRSYLVMSAATEYKAMNAIIDAFSVFDPRACILTKLDEAVMIGSALSSIIEHNLPLSFITNGQQVPEDIDNANAQSLIGQCVTEMNSDTDQGNSPDQENWRHKPMHKYHDQAAGIRKMSNPTPVKVIAITSGKGGAGKTNLSVNLGIALAQSGRKVAILDADMGLANVDILLGIYPKFNLSHVLTGEKTLPEIMQSGPFGLKIIPGASGIQKMAELTSTEQAAMIHAFSELDYDLDILIVDTAAGISAGVVNFTRACQEIIVVVCDEPTSLTDAYAFIKLLNRDYKLSNFHVITNMVKTTQQGLGLFQKLTKVTDHYLDVTLRFVGAIPYDENLRKSVQKQIPVTVGFPESKASLAIKEVAGKIDKWPVKAQSGSFINFFVERIIQYDSHRDVA